MSGTAPQPDPTGWTVLRVAFAVLGVFLGVTAAIMALTGTGAF